MSAATLHFPLASGSAPIQNWTLDQGVDISAPALTPELAVTSGTVTYQPVSGFGNNVPLLRGDNGVTYYYGHAGPNGQVAPGTHVKAGQEIATVGAGIVGHSTGPHLEIGVVQPGGSYGGGAAALKAQLAGVRPGSPGWTPGDVLTGNFPGGPADHSTPPILSAQGIATDLINWVKPSALKLLLYAVFIFGGVGLAIYGLAQMLKPAGIDVAGAAKSAGKVALAA